MAIKIFGIHLFRGIASDIRSRLPHYIADWTTDAWNYRIIPATIYMYFANILPAIVFALDMFTKTHNSYGVNEILLASALGSLSFSVFAGQPLCIVGVTGPISVFNYTVYEIMVPKGTSYFPFMCWICLWSMIMHFAIAITNGVNGLRYITRFSCDTFGLFNALIYIQKGIQVLTRQFSGSNTNGFISAMVALASLMAGFTCQIIGTGSTLFCRPIRRFLADYGTPLTVVFFTGFVHIGKMRGYDIKKLPVGASFEPTASAAVRPHGWFIHFWEDISVGEVFLALPFALLLTVLFYFDHNVSSLICQGSEFPLKKPPSFHWDFFLLGIVTGVSGLLGIPTPNGLIPQAPFHTISLCVIKQTKVPYGQTVSVENKQDPQVEVEEGGYRIENVVERVIEQRVSNFAQGLMIMGTMSAPLLTVLGLIPQAVLAGLFWIMGLGTLRANGVIAKILYLCEDHTLTPASQALHNVPKRWIYLFVFFELASFGATFAVCQTIAAVGFPAILIGFSIFAIFLPRIFPKEVLNVLDAPTASEFIMESVTGGGSTREAEDQAVSDAMPTAESDTAGEGSMRRRRRGRRRNGGDAGKENEEKVVELQEASSFGDRKDEWLDADVTREERGVKRDN
ncbi:HCO3 transporter family-domain-containing protein [Limtongia smithiae]|uniref:HCO3 transporter family-domain-containing protein n=1 Tax=Limtongia smithiae TaxID=1125753 RepID=UPI0034D01E73